MIPLLRRWLAFVALFPLSFAPQLASAQLSIEIVGGGAATIPIAIVPFDAEATWPLGISGIVGADLVRSGLFRLVDTAGVVPRPVRAQDVQFATWRARNADAVVVGSMLPLPDGRAEVRFALVDVVKQTPLAQMAFTVSPQQFRITAHRIADVIYEKLTGDRGRVLDPDRLHHQAGIALSAAGRRRRRLRSAIDRLVERAAALAALVARRQPAGLRLVREPKPVVYVQSLDTGARRAVANFRGSNSSPAWSPDGRKLAVTLTKDGGSQVYLMNPDGSGVTRVMTSQAIDTEAMFTPDGQSLIFTSDRGGTPQIYRASLLGGRVERLTFEGSYNVSPKPLPDGKGMVFVRRDGGRFEVATLDYATHQVQVLTPGPNDESPSVAPNGKLVIYASEGGGHGILAAVSIDGRVKQRLVAPAADVREPAWGPFPRS